MIYFFVRLLPITTILKSLRRPHGQAAPLVPRALPPSGAAVIHAPPAGGHSGHCPFQAAVHEGCPAGARGGLGRMVLSSRSGKCVGAGGGWYRSCVLNSVGNRPTASQVTVPSTCPRAREGGDRSVASHRGPARLLHGSCAHVCPGCPPWF